MSEISAGELKAKLETGAPVAVVDIREAHEYEDWHIPGSRNLPVHKALKSNQGRILAERVETLPRDRPIVAVCRAGLMSRKAVELLRSLGFEAASLTGGIRGWGAVWSEAAIPWRSRDGELLIQFRRNGKGCLSYLIGAGGEAAVVDPSIEVSAYREAARRRGLRITHVLETHVHADHISRARELCEIEGAKLVMPPNRRVTYPFTPIRDGETLSIGGLSVEAVATPGHTSESVCYRVGDQALLTGDTLFVESVGRPDLERGDAGAEAAARLLYRSLRERLLGRFDGIGVYPAHTGRPVGFDGQPIGASLTELRRELAWLGYEEKEFVDTVLASLQAKPPNFLEIISINEGKAGLAGKDPLDVEAGPNRCAAG